MSDEPLSPYLNGVLVLMFRAMPVSFLQTRHRPVFDSSISMSETKRL